MQEGMHSGCEHLGASHERTVLYQIRLRMSGAVDILHAHSWQPAESCKCRFGRRMHV
jgi:hypothetical protein